ncbi:MAG: DNA repair protein RecN [Gammaproteobacteria bacterium]|nr:DNA repair protein RecN [Gammaproteobacteria bacterium]
MISFLSVSNFKLAESVEVDFEPGFTVLTGETGAGKSLIIDALGLLLGDRAQADTIAAGAERAEFRARIELADEHPAHEWLRERELEADGECVLRRTLSRKSASRAFINGRTVSVQELRELGDLLVDVHGQHEHQHLAARERQRDTLDAFAGIEDEVQELAAAWGRMREARERLDRLKNRTEADRERARLLKFQVEELETLAVAPGEDERIQSDYNRLAHAQTCLPESAAFSTTSPRPNPTASASGSAAPATPSTQCRATTPPSRPWRRGSTTLAIEVAELATDLRARLSTYEFDPGELEHLQRRLDQLHGASRKYRVGIGELPELLERFRAELGEIDADDDALDRLQRELADIEADYDRRASAVSKRRAKAGVALGAGVEAELADLGMAKARFQVSLVPEDTPRAFGRESVEFLISTNPGREPGPLSRVASGGELSRVALAINMVCNRGSPALTQIYDEVDVGIGGRVAEMVGRSCGRCPAAGRCCASPTCPRLQARASTTIS